MVHVAVFIWHSSYRCNYNTFSSNLQITKTKQKTHYHLFILLITLPYTENFRNVRTQ